VKVTVTVRRAEDWARDWSKREEVVIDFGSKIFDGSGRENMCASGHVA